MMKTFTGAAITKDPELNMDGIRCLARPSSSLRSIPQRMTRSCFPGDAHHHGRVLAEDARQEEPQGLGHRRRAGKPSLPAHGRIHQVYVRDRPIVLGKRGCGDTEIQDIIGSEMRKGSHHQQLDVVMLLDPKQIP